MCNHSQSEVGPTPHKKRMLFATITQNNKSRSRGMEEIIGLFWLIINDNSA